MTPKPFLLDEKLLAENVFIGLTELGYAVTEEEAADVAYIVFEYLYDLGMEIFDDDDE